VRRRPTPRASRDRVPVDEVFDTRVLNLCRRAGVERMGDFRGTTARELLKVRRWGRKAILEVQLALEEMELPPLRSGDP